MDDRVDGGDEQRARLPAGAERAHVTGDVTEAAERVRVVGRDAAARAHAAVERAAHVDQLVVRAARHEPLVHAVLAAAV